MKLDEIVDRLEAQGIECHQSTDENDIIGRALDHGEVRTSVHWSNETVTDLPTDTCLRLQITRGFDVFLACPIVEADHALFEAARLALLDALVGWVPTTAEGHRVRYVGAVLERLETSLIAFTFSFSAIYVWRKT